jgi:hypothetical protein
MQERRSRHVQDFLFHRLAPVCRLDVYPADTWQGSPFGWEPPVLHEGLFIFRHCPALIASHTATLFVDDVDDYLMAIVSVAFLHVIHMDVPTEERVRVVESTLYDTAPGSVALLSKVEAAVLDKQ